MTRSLHYHRPRVDSTGRILVTRRAAVIHMRVPTTVEYLRKACLPVACDVHSRAVLYDLDELVERFHRRVA